MAHKRKALVSARLKRLQEPRSNKAGILRIIPQPENDLQAKSILRVTFEPVTSAILGSLAMRDEVPPEALVKLAVARLINECWDFAKNQPI